MDSQQRAELSRLRSHLKSIWDKFEVADPADEHGWNYREYLEVTLEDRRRVYNIETLPWVKAASALDVKVPPLFNIDEDEEPDVVAFEKLKRDVRAAHKTVAREWLQAVLPTIGLLVAAFGLAISTLSAYKQHVFERDRVSVSIAHAGFEDARQLEFEVLVSNSGTRPIALTSMNTISLHNINGTLVPRYEYADPQGVTFPLIIKPGEMIQIAAAVTENLAAAFKDPEQGRLVDPRHKSIRYLLQVVVMDASGFSHSTDSELVTQTFADDGTPTIAALGGPFTLFDRFRWFGSMGAP